MSLILEALHRSEQERTNADAVPGIQTRHGESDIVDMRTRWWLAGAAALVALVLIWWLIASRSPAAGGSGELPEPTAQPSISVEPAVVVAPELPLVSAPPPQPAAKVAELPATRPEQPVQARAEAALPAEVAALYQREERPAPPATVKRERVAPAARSLPVEAIVAAAEQELVAPPVDDDPTPLVKDLPQRTKDAIPSIFFSSHSWSSKASEKTVTLNGEIRREGDTVLPGLRLVEIQPESILLDFQGTRFRLRALNSWVNL